MTEPQGGSDPNLFKTHAVRDGDEWVINGEKWFTSAGRVADILFVMCTNGMFVVPRETPGVEIQPEPRNHNHIIYNDVRVPARPPARPRGRRQGARAAAPRRRSHPPRDAHHRPVQARLRHDVRAGAQPRVARQDHRRAPDGAGEDRRLLRRRSGCCACSCSRRRGRSTTRSTQETRTDIAAVKYTMAKVLREVSFNALHILGSLGTTNLTPLQAMYAGGADDGHRRRRRRGAQGHRRPQRAQGLPARTRATGRPSTSRPSGRRRGRSSSRCSTPTPSCARSPRATRSTSPAGADRRRMTGAQPRTRRGAQGRHAGQAHGSGGRRVGRDGGERAAPRAALHRLGRRAHRDRPRGAVGHRPQPHRDRSGTSRARRDARRRAHRHGGSRPPTRSRHAPPELADAYAAQSDWDPRADAAGYVFLVLRPDRVQAWTEVHELAGRTIMRAGEWVV